MLHFLAILWDSGVIPKPSSAELFAELKRYGQLFRGNPYFYTFIFAILMTPAGAGIAVLRYATRQSPSVALALFLCAGLLFLLSIGLIGGLLWRGATVGRRGPGDCGVHHRPD